MTSNFGSLYQFPRFLLIQKRRYAPVFYFISTWGTLVRTQHLMLLFWATLLIICSWAIFPLSRNNHHSARRDGQWDPLIPGNEPWTAPAFLFVWTPKKRLRVVPVVLLVWVRRDTYTRKACVSSTTSKSNHGPKFTRTSTFLNKNLLAWVDLPNKMCSHKHILEKFLHEQIYPEKKIYEEWIQ